MIKIESSTLSDVYEEYLLIDDVATKIGDTSIDLSPYYTKTEVDKFIQELDSTFLASLEALRVEVNKKAGQAELDKLASDIDNNVNTKLQQIENTIGDINSLLEEVNTLLDDVNGEVV